MYISYAIQLTLLSYTTQLPMLSKSINMLIPYNSHRTHNMDCNKQQNLLYKFFYRKGKFRFQCSREILAIEHLNVTAAQIFKIICNVDGNKYTGWIHIMINNSKHKGCRE
jgi:hypothetical protein